MRLSFTALLNRSLGQVMSSFELAYYQERLRTERLLAAAADSKIIASAHEVMVQEYERRISALENRPTLKIVPPKA